MAYEIVESCKNKNIVSRRIAMFTVQTVHVLSCSQVRNTLQGVRNAGRLTSDGVTNIGRRMLEVIKFSCVTNRVTLDFAKSHSIM